MAKASKLYRITKTKSGRFGGDVRTYTQEGTLEELIKAYSYTLECGRDYQHEKGNKKINTQPKNIKSLVTNLYNASNNRAADGYSGETFSYVEL